MNNLKITMSCDHTKMALATAWWDRWPGYLGLSLIHKATDTLLVVAIPATKVIVSIVGQDDKEWLGRLT